MCVCVYAAAKRLQENASGLDVHTEATHRGIDALQDRFDEMEVVCFPYLPLTFPISLPPSVHLSFCLSLFL